MFQTGGLIVFCGLLAQTTALQKALPSPLDQTLPLAVTLTLAPTPTDLAGSLTRALSNGLLSKGLSGTLENLPLSDNLKTEGVTSRSLFGGMLGGILGKVSLVPVLSNIIDVKVTNPQLLEVGLKQSPDGHRLYATIPLGMTLHVKIPLLGSLLKLAVKLNITAELLTLKEKQKETRLVLGSCIHSSSSLEISLLNRFSLFPVQRLLNSVRGILPKLVQSKVCPLVNATIGRLDATLGRATVDTLVNGLKFASKV